VIPYAAAHPDTRVVGVDLSLVEALPAVARGAPIAVEHGGRPASGEVELPEALSEHVDTLAQHLAEMKLLGVS